jgi:hypothetical protein
MPVAKKNYKRPKTKRVKQRGGDSATYSFGSSSVSPGAPYAQTVVPGSACQAATKFDAIAGYTPPGRGGLPGYAGGGRRTRKQVRKHLGHKFAEFSKRVLKSLHFFKKAKGSRRRQRGGAPYTLNVAQTTSGPNPFVPVSKGSCEGGPVTTQQYSAPGVQRGGVGGVDSAFLQMQNAGYSNEAPKWTSSVGTPGGGSMVQTPYAAGQMNPACLHTGGRRRGGRARRGKGRNSRRKCY